jgi:hypothetical protein
LALDAVDDSLAARMVGHNSFDLVSADNWEVAAVFGGPGFPCLEGGNVLCFELSKLRHFFRIVLRPKFRIPIRHCLVLCKCQGLIASFREPQRSGNESLVLGPGLGIFVQRVVLVCRKFGRSKCGGKPIEEHEQLDAHPVVYAGVPSYRVVAFCKLLQPFPVAEM